MKFTGAIREARISDYKEGLRALLAANEKMRSARAAQRVVRNDATADDMIAAINRLAFAETAATHLLHGEVWEVEP